MNQVQRELWTNCMCVYTGPLSTYIYWTQASRRVASQIKLCFQPPLAGPEEYLGRHGAGSYRPRFSCFFVADAEGIASSIP